MTIKSLGFARALVMALCAFILFRLLVPASEALDPMKGLALTAVSFVAASVANATAVGGGFIFLPFFIAMYALPAQESLKLSLCTQAFGMTSGMLSWSWNLIDRRVLTWAVLSGGAGVILGTLIITPGVWIKPAFGVASVVIGTLSLMFVAIQARRTRNGALPPASVTKHDLIVFAVLCFVSGVITSWVSIGIGEIVALWMILKAQDNAARSVATGVATLAICSIIGAALHFNLGGVPVGFLTYTVPGVIMGGFVGAQLAKRLVLSNWGWSLSPQFCLKLLISVVILLDGIVTLYIWHR